jgi:hypothetical protein
MIIIYSDHYQTRRILPATGMDDDRCMKIRWIEATKIRILLGTTGGELGFSMI